MRYSVITINYNNKDGLRNTIESTINQTCNDFEYIIIDGGSTDGSVDVIKESAERINYWISEKDRGIYHAMNKGVAQAHGDYCIFMNSGDCFYDNMVLKHFVHKLNEDIVVGKLISNKTGQVLFCPPRSEISLYYLYSGTVPHQSSFIKTELLRQFPYDESLKLVSDWKFFLQAIILQNCSVRYLDDYVAIFDMDGVSTSNSKLVWKEKEQVLFSLFPPRVLADYRIMKESECLTQTITSRLRYNYKIDKLLYRLGLLLLKIRSL